MRIAVDFDSRVALGDQGGLPQAVLRLQRDLLDGREARQQPLGDLVDQMLDGLRHKPVKGPAHEVADRYPAKLSGGQQQRVAVARALINNPTLLLADEPTGALDTHSGDQVMDLLAQLHRDGQTILLVTHDAKLATRHASRVLSVIDGKVVDDARLETTERTASDVVRVRSEETSR